MSIYSDYGIALDYRELVELIPNKTLKAGQATIRIDQPVPNIAQNKAIYAKCKSLLKRFAG